MIGISISGRPTATGISGLVRRFYDDHDHILKINGSTLNLLS